MWNRKALNQETQHWTPQPQPKEKVMSRIASLTTVTAAAAVLAFAGGAQAATFFSDSLKDTSVPSEFNVASSDTEREPTFTSDGVEFALGGNNERNYLRTNETNYHTASKFDAFITVETRLGDSWDNDSQLFFGLGAGDVGDFGLPDRGEEPAIHAQFNNQEGGDIEIYEAASSGKTTVASVAYPTGVDTTNVTTTAIRLRYDKTAGTVQYDVDFDYTGDGTYAAFTSDVSSGAVTIPEDVVDAWNDDGAASSIVFGGDGGQRDNSVLRVSDFAVVPEPGSLTLMGLGVLLMSVRRRPQHVR